MKPKLWQVCIAAICAAGTVWSFAEGRISAQWVWWLALFLVLELTAAVNKEDGDTFSENVWIWFGIRPVQRARLWRIPIVGVFVLVLGLHFVTGGSFWWSGGSAVITTGVPVAVVIGRALRKGSNG